MPFKSQATGAMRFQRLPAEMLTAQNLTDDADGLIAVDRLRHVGLGQSGVVL